MSIATSANPAALPEDSEPRRHTGFVNYVLETSENPDELKKWFRKPQLGGVVASPEAPSSKGYTDVPDELRRHALLKKAEEYTKQKTFRHPSFWLVWVLTVIFFVPALFVRVVFDARSFFFPPKDAKASHPPGHWTHARTWALWVVYIPWTRYQGNGGIKGAILPSQAPKFLNDQAAAVQVGDELARSAEREWQRTQHLYKRAVTLRRRALEQAEEGVEAIFAEESPAGNAGVAEKNNSPNTVVDSSSDSPPPTSKNVRFNNALREYESLNKTALRLKEAADSARAYWDYVREMADTETCAAATSYRGIADWASDAYDSYSNLMNAISAVCFVGAGLTYSSIFGATRGNIGLMCWSFSLFIVGLSILITVQSLLMWCSRLKNYPFSTPKLWEFFLGIGVYGACAAVVTAIALLVVTVLNLQFHVGEGGAYFNPNAPLWDAHLVFNISPRYAAIVAFSFIGAGVIVALLVFSLFSMANTVKLLLWRRSIERSRKHRVKLDDLV